MVDKFSKQVTVPRNLAIFADEILGTRDISDSKFRDNDDKIPYLETEFSDGSKLTCDLVRIGNRYEDHVVWHSPDGKNTCEYEPEYEIGDYIYVSAEGSHYVVYILAA